MLKARRQSSQGFVLVLALGLLAVFGLMGAVWVQYMQLEQLESRQEQWQLHANHVAQGGIQAAIGDIQAALNTGGVSNLDECSVPVLKTVRGGGQNPLAADVKAAGHASVTITDECARINVNFASTRVLRALFGSGDRARLVRKSLPRTDGAADDETGSQRWLVNLDDLVTRGLIDAGTLASISEDDLTLYTVPDPSNPAAFINVNTASPAVLEAVLAVDAATAGVIVANRPFTTVDQLVAAAGKPANTFNVRPDLATPDALPKQLCFSSRCFRIISKAKVTTPRGEDMEPRFRGGARAEAVVYFPIDGRPQVRFSSTVRNREG